MTISASSLNGRRHMAKVGINREIGHLTEMADCRETCSLYQYKRIQEIIHIIYNVKGIYNVESVVYNQCEEDIYCVGGYKHYNKSRRTDHYRLDCFVFSMVYPFVFSMAYPVTADDL